MIVRPKHRVSAKVFMKSPDGTAVLMTVMAGEKYGIPGGHVEKNETPYQALFRELGEELGLKTEDLVDVQPYDFWKDLGADDRIIVAYTATLRPEAVPAPDGEEILSVRWVTKEMLESGEVQSPTYAQKLIAFLS